VHSCSGGYTHTLYDNAIRYFTYSFMRAAMFDSVKHILRRKIPCKDISGYVEHCFDILAVFGNKTSK